MDVERNIKISLIEDPTADAPGHLTLDVENESLVNQSGTVGHRKENWTSNIHHLQFFFIYEMLVEVCGSEIHGFDWGQLKSRPFHTSFDIFSSCFSTEPNEWAHHANSHSPFRSWSKLRVCSNDPLIHAIGHRQVMLGVHGAFGQQPRLGFKIKLFERLTKFQWVRIYVNLQIFKS